jgi:hypothetical protein
LLESGWSRTDSTTEAIAESIRTITRATANSKRNITQHIPQNALCKRLRKTPVSYWKLVGNCLLLESSWSRTDSTTEAIANSISTITTATANSKRNITQLIPQKASSKQPHKTPVSHWKIVGNCILL